LREVDRRRSNAVAEDPRASLRFRRGERTDGPPPRPVGGQRFCRADYHRRERQRQMKNDETRPSPEAACEEFFPGV